MWYEYVWKHTTRQPVKVWTTMYATTYKTGMWMDFPDVDPSAKKNRVQEPMLPSLHLGVSDQQKTSDFQGRILQIRLLFPFIHMAKLGFTLGWLNKKHQRQSPDDHGGTSLAAPRGSVARSKMVLAAVT